MKIVSGGQTGADRAALDFGIKHGLETGGWVPKGRLAEDGPIPDSYSTLRETKSSNYSERTKRNIQDSDGTLIVSHGNLTGGSLLTKRLAASLGKPFLHIDFRNCTKKEVVETAREWITANGISTLNVAGSRASGDPEIYDATYELLTMIFV